MKTFKVPVGAHRIEMSVSMWTGKQIVRYDGEVRSEKRELSGHILVHSFEVREEGEHVVYEVNFFPSIWGRGFALRRNGIILAHEP